MTDDPTIRWHQASPFGILRNEANNAWNSGHVTEVLQITDAGGLLVGTQTGGAWWISAANDALDLSDGWDPPDVACLAQGPDGPRHFFAGSGRGILETDAAALSPLLAWQPVGGLPTDAGLVRRIVVIPRLRRILVACSKAIVGDVGGLYWAVIPPTRFEVGGGPRPPYVWRRATVQDHGQQGYWDVAIASLDGRQLRSTLEDRAEIIVVAGGFTNDTTGHGGVFSGQWDSADNLILTLVSVKASDGTDLTDSLFNNCGTASVSSCERTPTVLYAVCAYPDGRLQAVLLSMDAGRQWTVCDSVIRRAVGADGSVPAEAGDQGKDWNNRISAHPTHTPIAALGWKSGTYVTADGGSTWQLIANDEHLHEDVHALTFDPTSDEGFGDLYIGSDGGVARVNLTDFLGRTDDQPFQSDYNRLLPALQCYSTLIRQFYGTLDASAHRPGFTVAGLQDNANVFAFLRGPTPWRRIKGKGDGGWNVLLNDGILHQVMGGPIELADLPDAAGGFASVELPVFPGTDGLRAVTGAAVVQPTMNAAGRLLVAVASAANLVYGLYADPGGTPRYRWELLATLPTSTLVGALASFNGSTVLAGTWNDGRMFQIIPATGAVRRHWVRLPRPSPSTRMRGGTFLRIVFFTEAAAFALLDGANEQPLTPPVGPPVTPPPVLLTAHYVLRLQGEAWAVTPGIGLPGELMYGLEAVNAPGTELAHALVVSTDDAVFVSRDEGQNWRRASLGLPRRAHCGDLRFVADDDGGSNLYLGTYGRSVWIAPVRLPDW